MNTPTRTRPGHWADRPAPDATAEPASTPATTRFPFWPFALCVGFPFLVALVVWLVLTSLQP